MPASQIATTVESTDMNSLCSIANAVFKEPIGRWLRLAIGVNLVLLAMPVVAIVSTYIGVRFFAERPRIDASEGPVIYEQHLVLEIDPWFSAAYFLIPNALLAAIYLTVGRKKAKNEVA